MGSVGVLDFIVSDDRATLIWLAQLAGLELHPSLALAEEPGRPTVLAFDLDPGAPATAVECARVAQALERAEPDLVVSQQKKELRKGKVLVDWSQNDYSKTTVAAYSLRCRERPWASTPLRWEEVEALADDGDPESVRFEAPELLERVAEHGDLFAPVLELEQRLPDFPDAEDA